MRGFLGILCFISAMVFTVRWLHRWAFKYLDEIKPKADGDFWGCMLCACAAFLCLFSSIL